MERRKGEQGGEKQYGHKVGGTQRQTGWEHGKGKTRVEQTKKEKLKGTQIGMPNQKKQEEGQKELSSRRAKKLKSGKGVKLMEEKTKSR